MVSVFKKAFQHSAIYPEVRNINIYALRVLFVLMFFVLGKQVWSYIFGHSGTWDSDTAVAYSVFAGFSLLAGLGIINPIKMIPLLLLEIFYKVMWLVLVAYPLWHDGSLAGSSVEERTFAFSFIILPLVAIPWKYVYKTYAANLTEA